MSTTLLVIILGIVEGLTEYLPVSSTGHLILATELLGFDAAEWAVFNIAIQPGAILAVVVLYWKTFWGVLKGLFKGSKGAFDFTRNILVAFFPAVAIGVIWGDSIDNLLENAVVVAWALIIGGVGILLVEKLANPPARPDIPEDQVGGAVATIGFKRSLLVGLVQCLAMIPGVSRSGATIMGAMAFGIDRKTAAEFSFFLAVPTLSGATVYSLWKARDAMVAEDMGWIGLGALVSFFVAYIVVKAFISIVTKIGFAPFAWYRIAVGVAALFWLGAI
ncbi:undecaprenyl-diphosphate phosphatase [Sphingomicrobium astaxanthinifaciens]|uniref:undecaprenyl-diphosphate phosphatase n=1 Tax=Sphingomicrobium astaxanthinifaciens TaxID=1227949 RepID=UPI001FCAE706|nr:undecaprenyl-diphosphate phosphatase [Sphingomicrobium astaxanthinifaciens]MCJ7421543.1 undecaprenyl-diphosphate phosphatase [Sphingomicrobium astaxanthinifaciens]